MVIYVHPIENKVTIVRRDNKVTVSHVGVQGERGPELMIQYSRDGVSGWHAVPTVDDDYLRFSTDEGRTWGSAVWFNTIDECYDYMIKSQAWAENPVDIEVENGKYSALHHRVYAEQAENEAKQARDNAIASMNAAASSAAASASQSASNALSSANDAELSKQKAYQWAENPVDIEVEAGKYSSLHHRTYAEQAQFEAEQARDNAAASMNAAAASAASASQSASSALSSANDAELSKQKAYQWAENPVDIEVENGKYSALHHRVYAEQAENEAKQARDNAIASMNAAAASAASASQSASNALSSANDAELSKQKAYQWAENPVDIEVEAGLYSAKHWAIKSQEYSVTAASDVPYDNAESGLDGANVQAALDEIATEYQTRAEKGLPNGYASLDSDGYLSEVAKQVQLSTPITVSLTGEVLGSVQVDLSSNVSVVTSFSGPGFLLELDENGDLMPTDIPVEG